MSFDHGIDGIVNGIKQGRLYFITRYRYRYTVVAFDDAVVTAKDFFVQASPEGLNKMKLFIIDGKRAVKEDCDSTKNVTKPLQTSIPV